MRWGVGGLAAVGVLAVVLWAPLERATLLITLAGVVVTGLVGWWGSTRR
ncbi:hypothetical protein [Streptosporangium sp. NPDC023615]